MHPTCKKVRLVDRCAQCNPGYDDRGTQTYEIYLEVKRTGVSLREAEQSWLRRHGHSR